MSNSLKSCASAVNYLFSFGISVQCGISACFQVFQLQQEKKKLQEDLSSLLQDRETLERKCATIQREQTQLGPCLEETKWEVGWSLPLERC